MSSRTMTDVELSAIRVRLARIAGKWSTIGTKAPGIDDINQMAWIAHGPLRCHATERGRNRQWAQACADADFLAAAPTDIAALIEEVERLRDEVERFRADIERYGSQLEAAHDRGVAEERAAVVAWLRTQRLYCTDSTGAPNAVSATYAHAAEAIERGEHRREEK